MARTVSNPFVNAAIFILGVSSAVLLHDVSARAGDESMGIAGRRLFNWLNSVAAIRKIERRLDFVNVRSPGSIKVQPMIKKVIPSNACNYVSTRKQQSTLQLTTISTMKIAVIDALTLLPISFSGSSILGEPGDLPLKHTVPVV